MFSGIIRHHGTLVSISPKGEGYVFSIDSPTLAAQTALGDSVAHSGVCLTVSEMDGTVLRYEVMPETLRKTTLGSKKLGDMFNLEPSLRLGDEMGGHMVFGHVDGVGAVSAVEHDGDSLLVTFVPPPDLLAYMGPQGSVAIDGVSLTVARIADTTFTVSLIDYTQEHTTLGALVVGSTVNLECDMLAKYVARQMKVLGIRF